MRIMNKKLLSAFAVAGLVSSGVWADSSVTMYGIADVSYASGSSKQGAGVAETKFSGIESGFLLTSRIGFKGQEELSSGLKAIFNLEYGLDIDEKHTGVDSDHSVLTSRHHWAGIEGSFGQIVAGRVEGRARQQMKKYSAFFTSVGLDAHADAASSVGLISNGDRLDNAISWVSPKFGAGLTVAATYSFDGEIESATSSKRSALQLSADYESGPFGVGVHYHKLDDADTISVASDYGSDQFGIGANYDFGAAKVYAFYQEGESEDPANTSESNVVSFGVKVPVGAGAIIGQYAMSELEVGGTDSKAGSDNFAIAYVHGLSKRTSAYVGYVSGEGDDNGRAVGVAGLPASGIGEKANAFAVGLAHKF